MVGRSGEDVNDLILLQRALTISPCTVFLSAVVAGSGSGLASPARGRVLVVALRSGHERLEREPVIQHRPVGRDLVPLLHGSQDAPMVLVGPRRAAGRVQRFLAALG